MSEPRQTDLEGARKRYETGDVEGRRRVNRQRLREIARVEGVAWLVHEVQVIAAWTTCAES